MYKFLIPLLVLLLSFLPEDAQAQFRDKKQGLSAKNYNTWLQKQNEFKGFSPSRKELIILGKKPSEVRSNSRDRKKKTKNKS